MRTDSGTRAFLTPSIVIRLLLGWGAFSAVTLAEPLLSDRLSTPVLFAVLAGIIAVITVCAFGVVTEAEYLARRLGDPYGTLVLTLSIVLIEVILISAVMLGPGDHATIARDSVMAVAMIILNLVVGVALLVGGTRHRNLQPNRTGVSTYLSHLVVLTMIAFAPPGLIGTDGGYAVGQAVPIIVLTVALYVFFLYRQMGPQRADFQEISTGHGEQTASSSETSMAAILSLHRREIIVRIVLLVIMVVPIVLLSHHMATLLDDGLDRLGAPVALSGILIAMIVFLPETITTIRAASMGEIQRVSNLCHGALVSTVALTIPTVQVIGLLTGQTVVLAESATNLVLLGVSLLMTATTFFGKRVTAAHGTTHLLVFGLYCLTVFS